MAGPHDVNPSTSRIDWDATAAFRQHIWGLGLGVADAMDTAQRGMGLGWPAARELIVRSGAAAQACGACWPAGQAPTSS
ncbi:MAG: DUF993 family protein [Acidimicrobiales bacterium]